MFNLESINKILFPERCVGCQRYPNILCNTCKKNLEPNSSNCYICKTPSENFETHYNCKGTDLKHVFVCYKYTKVIERLIISLKYDFYMNSAKVIAGLISTSGNTPPLEEYTIIPTPIHWKRKNLRGFNQCSAILKELNKIHSNQLCISECLVKVKNSKHQLGSSKEERKINIKNTIALNKDKIQNLGINKFLIFDDICTTGTTLEECAKVIHKQFPSADISALVLSRG